MIDASTTCLRNTLGLLRKYIIMDLSLLTTVQVLIYCCQLYLVLVKLKYALMLLFQGALRGHVFLLFCLVVALYDLVYDMETIVSPSLTENNVWRYFQKSD